MSNHDFNKQSDVLLASQRAGTISMDTLTCVVVANYVVSPDAVPTPGSSLAILRLTREIVWC